MAKKRDAEPPYRKPVFFFAQKKTDESRFFLLYVLGFFIAEEEGFEPPEPFSSTVFKTAAIDRSAIPPMQRCELFLNYQNFCRKKIIFFRHLSLKCFKTSY